MTTVWRELGRATEGLAVRQRAASHRFGTWSQERRQRRGGSPQVRRAIARAVAARLTDRTPQLAGRKGAATTDSDGPNRVLCEARSCVCGRTPASDLMIDRVVSARQRVDRYRFKYSTRALYVRCRRIRSLPSLGCREQLRFRDPAVLAPWSRARRRRARDGDRPPPAEAGAGASLRPGQPYARCASARAAARSASMLRRAPKATDSTTPYPRVLRHAREGPAPPPLVRDSLRGTHSRLQQHRNVLQPDQAPLDARHRLPAEYEKIKEEEKAA